MAGRDMNEHERRELANAHRGDMLVGPATPIEPRRLDQVVSLRLEPETIAALRDIATRRGSTVSDLLREGAGMVIATEEPTMRISHLSFDVTLMGPETQTGHGARHTVNPIQLDQELSATA